MADGDDTVDEGGEVVNLEVVKGGKPEDVVAESAQESLDLIDDVRDQVAEGGVTSLLLFALTSDGSLTRLILSNNKFELAGLALEVQKMIDEEGLS